MSATLSIRIDDALERELSLAAKAAHRPRVILCATLYAAS